MATQTSATRKILLIVGGLILLLVLLGAVGWATGMLGGGEDGLAVETAPVERRDLTQVVTAFGRVQPEVEVTISPDVPGEIVELPVREGQPVREGTLLARIKPDDYIAQAEQAQAGVSERKAQLAQSEADLAQAKSDFERKKKLYENEYISESAFQVTQSQYEQSQARVEAARYAVESAAAQRRQAGEQIAKTSLYAPMDGVVSKLNVELGERVVGTSQMAGTEMMRIARLDQMEMEVDVNENDVVNVALEDTASIEVDAYPDRPFKGVVTEIANSARVSAEGTQEQVTNFPVKVRVLDAHNLDAGTGAVSGGASGQSMAQGDSVTRAETPMPTPADAPTIRPGMSGAVDVFTKTVKDAVAVPIQSVTVRDFNKVKPDSADGDAASGGAAEDTSGGAAGGPQREDLRKVVFLFAENGEARMVEVETGISDDTHIQITSGLSGDETVITGPYRAVSRELEPGQTVREDDGGGGPAIASNDE